jgi:hypothetical protein
VILDVETETVADPAGLTVVTEPGLDAHDPGTALGELDGEAAGVAPEVEHSQPSERRRQVIGDHLELGADRGSARCGDSSA